MYKDESIWLLSGADKLVARHAQLGGFGILGKHSVSFGQHVV